MKPVIVEELPLNGAELKSALENIQKRDGELSFRGNKTLEYLNQLTLPAPKKAGELKKKLEELNIPRLKDTHVHKIIDVMPKYVEDLKVLLQGYTITVKDEHLKKILDVIAEFR